MGRLRQQGDLHQARVLRQGEQPVHILYRLPRRPFDQIVDDRKDDYLPRPGLMYGDKAHVGTPH